MRYPTGKDESDGIGEDDLCCWNQKNPCVIAKVSLVRNYFTSELKRQNVTSDETLKETHNCGSGLDQGKRSPVEESAGNY